MEIGLDGPGDLEELHRIIDLIRHATDLYGKLPNDVIDLGASGSELGRLIDALPDPPVDFRLSIMAGLTAGTSCLRQVADFVVNGIPTTPIVMQTLVRTALLGAARIVFSLGPESHDDRVTNTLTAMSQEAVSLNRLYTVAESFTSLRTLIPPARVLVAQRRRIDGLRQRSKSLGEAATLREMAQVVHFYLVDGGYIADTAGYSEHIAWTFNVYSGVAHGYGWPRLVVGTESMPGHFIADLGMVAAVANLACDVVIRRSAS